MKTGQRYLATLIFMISISCGPDNVGKIKHGYLKGAEDAELYYRVIGSGQDTIVVLHGGPGAGMQSILPAAEPLANHYVLIFYDQRGGGRSELPADTTKLQSHYFVEDLEAVRKYFGINQMNVIAHSFGAILLAEYATKYPNRLRRILVHGATGPRRSEMAKYYQARARLSGSLQDTSLTHRFNELLQELLNGTAEDPVSTCREYEELGKKIAISWGEAANYKGTTCDAPPEAVRYYYRYTAQLAPNYFGNWDYTERLDSLTAPLLVIYGKLDSLGIPPQQEWADIVPNGRFLPIPNAAKGAFSDNPEFVFPKVVEFFSQ